MTKEEKRELFQLWRQRRITRELRDLLAGWIQAEVASFFDTGTDDRVSDSMAKFIKHFRSKVEECEKFL